MDEVTLDHSQFEDQTNRFFVSTNAEFEAAYCVFCGPLASALTLFDKGTMNVVRCQCGFVYNGNQPTQRTLNHFYSKSKSLEMWSELKKKQVKRQHDKFKDIVDALVDLKVKSVLDYGCGNGDFLELLRKRSKNIRILGMEQSHAAIKVALSKKIDISMLDIDKFVKQTDEKFDAVTMWGVLEHVKDPIDIVKKLKKVLKPNGHFVICVPNLNSEIVQRIWEKCVTFCPQHLWYFSESKLTKLMFDNGIKKIANWTIESEAEPVVKSMFGFHPYNKLPEWMQCGIDKNIKKFNKNIIDNKNGYKIVWIGKYHVSLRDHSS